MQIDEIKGFLGIDIYDKNFENSGCKMLILINETLYDNFSLGIYELSGIKLDVLEIENVSETKNYASLYCTIKNNL